MPIEIGELEIKVRIEDHVSSERTQRDHQFKSEDIIQEAVERVLRILRRKAEL
ncbi:MAG: DUF5908 family protein [Bacteroidota bacterium]